MKNLACLALAMTALAWWSVNTNAQVKKGKTRSALTKQLMAGLVKPNCAGLGEARKRPLRMTKRGRPWPRKRRCSMKRRIC